METQIDLKRIDCQQKKSKLDLVLSHANFMKRKFYLVWFTLAAVNVVFALSGRGNLYYLVTALFLTAAVIGYRKQMKGRVTG